MKVDRLITLLESGKPLLSRVDRISALAAVEGTTENECLDLIVYSSLEAGKIFQHEYIIAGITIRVKLVPVKARNHAGCQADQAIAAQIKNQKSPPLAISNPAMGNRQEAAHV